MSSFDHALRAIRQLAARVRRHIAPNPDRAHLPVDLERPHEWAVKDAELLIAFAAQSRKSLSKEKVVALTVASAALQRHMMAASRPAAEELAAFWMAYDSIAADMAPLSALSIRASSAINASRFPGSLFTPTAITAALAVLVFLVCLAVQGFWVAGKELVERADALEAQRRPLQERIALNNSNLQRARGKLNAMREQLGVQSCAVFNCVPFPPGFIKTDKASPASQLDPARVAALKAEAGLIRADISERDIVQQELDGEVRKLNERNAPLERLLTKWHERAMDICGTSYLRYLCPVDNPKAATERETTALKEDIARLKADLKQAEREPPADDPAANLASYATASSLGGEFRRTHPSRIRFELASLERELAAMDADRFRSIAAEVRIIIANIGTYIISMVMGLLGALTFILRTLSQQLREHTYIPTSASVSIVRICLGAIAGVFGSLLLPTSDPSLKSLSPLFIPFVFGYGIEILFSLLDKVVRNFAQPEPGSPAIIKP